MIKIGDTLPQTKLQQLTGDGSQTLDNQQLFAGKKVLMFAVPGAFTPTCSNTHLPGYVVNFDEFKGKGIDSIICLSVNDAFVMKAWGDSQNAENIMMLADGDGEFTKALGLDSNTGAFGGLRSQRYAMLIDDGVVTVLNVEAPKKFEVSNAETMLAAL